MSFKRSSVRITAGCDWQCSLLFIKIKCLSTSDFLISSHCYVLWCRKRIYFLQNSAACWKFWFLFFIREYWFFWNLGVCLVFLYSFLFYINSCSNSSHTEMINICICLQSIFSLLIYYHMVFGSPLALITLWAFCFIL